MRKSIFILIGVFALLFCAQETQAQSTDYFVGKWEILVEGTPNGDATSIFIFERKDDELAGVVQTEGQAPIKLSRVEEDGDEITAYFTSASGYEVYLYLEKIDKNKVEGSMMDMFDASGERIKEEKK